MKTQDFTIQTIQTISLSDSNIKEIVRRRLDKLGFGDFKIENGVLYRYERISWDEYDWVPFEKGSEKLFSNVEKAQNVMVLLGELLNE